MRRQEYKEDKDMKKYRVEFEFMVSEADITDGKWHKDYLDNNGEGFTFDEAERVACDLRGTSVCYIKWAEVVEM